jgi:glutathione synthase/RimK-type ligase-like ATP-grasp enzyme
LGRLRHLTAVHVGIVTRVDDFHAYVVRHTLVSRGVACSIIASDGLAGGGGMSWSVGADPRPAVVRDIDGGTVEVGALDLIWWRRLTGEPRLPPGVDDEAARDIVVNDCRATLLGMALTAFEGTWVSHPEATKLAENKLVQLQAAEQAGLRLPRTLVGQDPAEVRRFCEELDYAVVVKTVAGSRLTPLMTGRVTPELVSSDDAVSLSPAIYQEFVPGDCHLRVCCFGSEVVTGMIETDRLDWRYPLDAHVTPFDLDEETAHRVRMVVASLGLRMGIADMKLGPEGEPIWLEVNPQGQFLFLEGMCGMPLTAAFADFLEREAESPRRVPAARQPV